MHSPFERNSLDDARPVQEPLDGLEAGVPRLQVLSVRCRSEQGTSSLLLLFHQMRAGRRSLCQWRTALPGDYKEEISISFNSRGA